jgi:protein-tyrosine-phosphatase
MHIHFVCTGNAYRSRLAEAYLRAQQLEGVSVSSSGIRARSSYHHNGPISWYALRLLAAEHLIPFMSKHARQTTRKGLSQAQLVIFMQPQHYDWVKKRYRFEPPAYEIWSVPDVHEMGEDLSTEEELIRATERTFEQIKAKVAQLVEQVRLAAPAG